MTAGKKNGGDDGSRGDRPLEQRLADGEPIDWSAEEDAAPDDASRRRVRGMRRMAEALGAHGKELAEALETKEGLQIGPYRLVERVGEGGMGEVWLAEQDEPIRRRVALKLIKPGMDSRQVVTRFEAERQALAILDHPNVAKIFDAGVSKNGRPFFAMEYVEGAPITSFCDARRMTVEQRLKLFVGVCDAVQHAHQKAIIHRDLKPSNVLVTTDDAGQAVPKVIDFGIAKATDQRLTERTLFTRQGVMIGTPEYMSPEQADPVEADIDTRTDIYSLGAVLYQLLSGALPFDPERLREAGYLEIQRIIREEEPSRPSTRFSTLEASEAVAAVRGSDRRLLQRTLHGDLDWITMKALEKDRKRRYASASELASDLERYLRHEPVVARPPSTVYRVSRFARRHRVGVTMASAVLLLILGFAGTVSFQARRIARANQDLEAVAEFQSEMLLEMDTAGMGPRLVNDLKERITETAKERQLGEDAVRALLADMDYGLSMLDSTDAALRVVDEEILQRAVRALKTQFADRPAIEAKLLQAIGRAYMRIGLHAEAETPLVEALEIRERVLGPDHPATLWSVQNLAELRQRQRRPAEAESLIVRALEGRREVLGRDDPSIPMAMRVLSRVLQDQGRYDEAEQVSIEAIDAIERTLGPDDADTLALVNNLASIYASMGRYAKAEPLSIRVLEGRKRRWGDDSPDTLASMGSLAILYWRQGRLAEAETLLRQALDTSRRVLGGRHPNTMARMQNLATVCADLGRLEDAEALLDEALESMKRVHGEHHPDTLTAMSNLASTYDAQRRHGEAEELTRAALEGRRRVLGEEHEDTIISVVNLGTLYARQRRYSEAEPLFVRAGEVMKRRHGIDHPDTLLILDNLGLLYRLSGRDREMGIVVAEYLDGLRLRAESTREAAALNAYAWEALTCRPESLRDPDSALEFAIAANEQTGYENSEYLDTLALAHHQTGNDKQAIDIQRKALALLPADADRMRAELEGRLAMFEGRTP